MRRPTVGDTDDGAGGEPVDPATTPDLDAAALAGDDNLGPPPSDQPEPSGQAAPVVPSRSKRSRRRADEDRPSGPMAVLRETVTLVVLAVLLAVIFKTFLVQAFFIPSGSMESTLDISDRVLVEKLSYRFGEVQPGDIVVFVHNEPGLPSSEPSNPVGRFFTSLGQAIGLTPPSERDFIKRVVGVPGDTITCSGGKLLRNGKAVSEPYLAADTTTECSRVRVKTGQLYVMGDNRNNSQDSRVFGPIDRDVVVGRAFVRIWPFGRAGWLRRDG
jgi:signal peptidase I